MDDPRLNGGPDKQVPPRKADLTSRFLREILRRGALDLPGERRWMIQCRTTDVTSTSLRMRTWRASPSIVWVGGSDATRTDCLGFSQGIGLVSSRIRAAVEGGPPLGFCVSSLAIGFSHAVRLLQPCPDQLNHRLVHRFPFALGQAQNIEHDVVQRTTVRLSNLGLQRQCYPLT